MAPRPRRPRWLVALALAAVSLLAACSILSPRPAETSPPAPSEAPRSATPSQPTATRSAVLPKDGRPLERIPSVRPTGFADPPPGRGLDRYRSQPVSWQPCLNGLSCATVLVPLDYAKPDGPAISLALARRSATGTRRLGTLFINPGGPGGSGVEYVGFFEGAPLGDYDIVGWDPRGVAASTPVLCFGAADLDRLYAMDASPDDGPELQARIAAIEDFGESCLARSGRLLEHISTLETVRDLDLLRGLVGDRKINFFGSSYGTRIGSLYAEIFPQRVGRMILDGSVDIAAKRTITQIEGFERALDHFAARCGKQCRLGGTKAEVLSTIRGLLEQLDQRPLPVADGRVLTQQLGVEAVIYSLYGGERSWRLLHDALAAAVSDADPSRLMMLADRSTRRFADGSYDQISYSFQAVRCLDSQDASVRAAQRRYAAVSEDAPVLGRVAGPDLTCALWPVRSAPKQPTIDGDGAPPIVVIGTTGDPATPYEYAVNMADQLASGVLVTFNGEGHLAYGNNECISRIVVSYLMADQVPADQTTC